MEFMIIVDSNVWIFSENDNAEEHKLASLNIKEALDSGSFGINAIITSESFHKLSKILDPDEASYRVRHILEHQLAVWLEFSKTDAVKAIEISIREGVRINDAMIAQQALSYGAAILTDNVKDFRKIKGLKIIPLR